MTYSRGKIKHKGEAGYIFPDVLIALLIVTVGFGSVFFGIRLAANTSVKQTERIREIIIERNEMRGVPSVFTIEEQ